MDFSVITNLIGSIGFPILMCLMMYDRMGKQDQLHKDEMLKLTDTLNNNTLALNRLASKLGDEGVKNNE